jgi:asparagine synthase (glutamine-hydrolysing)
MQDTPRSPVLAAMPFFDEQKVVSVLDTMHTGGENMRVASQQILMMVLGACVLQDRYRLAA